MTRDERERYYGDVIYDVWRSGGNPDAVDPDRIRDDQDDGLWPDESAASIVRRQRTPTPAPGAGEQEEGTDG